MLDTIGNRLVKNIWLEWSSHLKPYFRAMPDAAEYIVVQAASALILDYIRRRFVRALSGNLGPGSLNSASDYFRVIHREGFCKMHIRSELG